VVSGCQDKIQHWKKVESDYDALQERLGSLPDRLSYDIMVPFGPASFYARSPRPNQRSHCFARGQLVCQMFSQTSHGLVDHRKKRPHPGCRSIGSTTDRSIVSVGGRGVLDELADLNTPTH
ncbi:unnamed protein product, partial [Staurois parvus]